ncbi:MAG: HAD family hydrolase [Planctomycetota bacterium]
MTATQAIIFDLDDTLYPEREFAFSGYQAVAGAFAGRLGESASNLVTRMRELFDTPDRRRVFDVILAEASMTEADAIALLAEMIATYRGHHPTISLHADADAALLRLRGRYRLGLISDGPLQMQRNKIAALGLQGRFGEVILTDRWGREFWKPHQRAFQEISRRLAVPADHCLYVADNPTKDFVAANSLGWRSVFVKRPDGIYADRPAPEGGAAQAVIGTLDALGAG